MIKGPLERTPRAIVLRPALMALWGVRGPEFAVTAMVALSLAAGTTVSLGIHRPWTTLPLFVAVHWVLWIAVRPTPDTSRGGQSSARWVLVGAAVWAAIGLVLASEYLIVMRDPGFLALSGVWLTDHPSTDIPTLGAIEAAATQANVLPDAWQAWNLEGDVVQPQGAKMLPAVLSVGGWLCGVNGVLAVNIIIGAVGILAVYVLARQLLGPRAALGPAAIMMLVIAHQGLSRSPYTEPLTLVLIVSAVAWAWRGLAENRPAALVAAGIASGATALVRIDGAAYAVGVLAGVVLVALVRGPAGRPFIVAFALPQAVMLAAGYGSLALWSAAYLERLGDQARTVGLAYLAVLALVMLITAAWTRRLHGAFARAFAPRIEAIGRAAALATAGLMVLVASRPLWMTDHRGTETETDEFTNGVVSAFQQAEGYAIEPTRTYAEHTLTWLSYYFTWPVLALATVGLAVIAYRAVTRDRGAFVFLAAVAAPSAIYMVKPEIVPDQLWAIRRFEPITLPGLAIAAGLGAWWLAHRYLVQRAKMTRENAAIVAAAALVLPLLSTYITIRPGDEEPVLAAVYAVNREQAGAQEQVEALCDVIGSRPVVLVGSSQYFGTVRVMCDVPVVLALVDPEPDALVDMTAVWGEPPVVLTQDPTLVGDGIAPVVTDDIHRGEYALQHMPRRVSIHDDDWFAATVDSDGSLIPVVPNAISDAPSPQ